jgi:hypothetical protein
MGRLLTTRRSEWIPGVAVLAAAAGIGSLLGVSIGIRSWSLYAGLVALSLLGIGALERLLARRRAPAPPRARARLRMIRGGKSAYDLESDERTKSQRYLM